MEISDKVTTGKENDSQSGKAVNVVIRTLKERCFLLQRRLRDVEDENVRLSKQCMKLNDNPNPEDDVKVLNTQLSKENAQLTQRILMVACENKNLWTRLAALTSSENDKTKVNNTNKIPQISDTKNNDSKVAMPQLIRSQTFTQTTPNPKLIAKLEEKDELEEISLKILNAIIAEKSELILQCEQMVELQNTPDFNVSTVGFTYLGDGTNYDSLAHIKQYTDKLMELKNVAMQQQNDLKTYISNLETKKQEEKSIPVTDVKNSPELSKENTGIDSPETEVLDSSTRWATPANSTSYHDNIDDSSCSQNTSKIMNNMQTTTNSKIKDEEDNFNNIPLKKNSNATCPMCGEQFQSTVSFYVFQKHVESHFVDEESDSLEEENIVLPVQ